MSIEASASWLFPLFVAVTVLAVQWMFWMPSVVSQSENTRILRSESPTIGDDQPIIRPPNGNLENQESNIDNSSTQTKKNEAIETKNNKGHDRGDDETDEDLFQMNDQWRCACEGGFLPPGLLKSFGGAEAMMRLGTGQCYHKQM